MFSFVQDFNWERLRIHMAKKSARKLVFFLQQTQILIKAINVTTFAVKAAFYAAH